MNRQDAYEAAPLLDRMLANLIATAPAKGRAGSDARTAIGDARANAFKLCVEDALSPPLVNCFTLARLAGSSLQQMAVVRQALEQETVVSLAALLVKKSGIRLCLATEARILSTMSFVSRQDVNDVKQQMFVPFQNAEEIAADDMDQATFAALVALHGTVVNHLVATAMPLPRMLNFQFYEPLPSLVIAYRLYGDAARADELRAENNVVHPAFCLPFGQALSS